MEARVLSLRYFMYFQQQVVLIQKWHVTKNFSIVKLLKINVKHENKLSLSHFFRLQLDSKLNC